jgi:hypothetical protein
MNIMGSIKRQPEIAIEVRGNYEKLSKSDIIEVCFSFAQMIYGEDLTPEEIMEKIEAERDLLKSYRQ